MIYHQLIWQKRINIHTLKKKGQLTVAVGYVHSDGGGGVGDFELWEEVVVIVVAAHGKCPKLEDSAHHNIRGRNPHLTINIFCKCISLPIMISTPLLCFIICHLSLSDR